MLPFFRKIRYRLASDNQFFKYSRYAVGEIVLVVIGIMIAIQLNNSNERRKKIEDGFRILSNLKEEIDQDIVYLNEISYEYSNWNNQAQKILDSVLNGKLTRLETLDQYNIGRGSMNFLHLTKSSFDELLSSGNNIIIENETLKTEIVAFYQKSEIEINKVNLDNERFNQWIYDKLDQPLWDRLSASRNLEHEDWSWLKDPKSEKFRLLEGYALFFQNAIQENLKVIQALEDECKIINDSISKELKKQAN